ncbi:pyruvate dehydrogenase complex dihydrolipoamide acetyltransferase [Kaistia algarum]|uniref:pyruvate dehydrogenase complex dihydrolipoamide acetyltransferase n=1 Tax=Kaistia algarum TaxID=2083279 RepID=UPI000CE787F7|nr:pyruvate dehydrogenase complex dihydrolipoamide acetyltransferase [Kaistia algarum]MCX5515841.1 pyruvate dehydrogenase complex dihydrolipoamide acetyltransferase [Kaistia algarum]PPE80790.1 pyruvate dehydrogenase complex dihydrolipoamide acetyltransferase [Kaistia algarum]
MPKEILMPSLSAGMEEGTLARWLKAEGDAVAAGEIIAEIETDKATMEMEAAEAGILGRLLVAAGTNGVPVNAPIAILLQPGESLAEAPTPAPAAPPAQPATPAAPKPAVATRAADDVSPRHLASPLARRLAAESNVDLASLTGSGPRGRIVRLDVERARAAVAPAPSSPAAEPRQAPASEAPVERVTRLPHSAMRRVIARRLLESKQTVPHFYLSAECEIDRLLALRADLNAVAADEYKLSVNDLVIKAAAKALRIVPEANAMWTEDAILRFDDVDVSVAVATDGGLITPVLRRADEKSLGTLSNEIKELAGRARANKLKPDDYQGGGFTVSNLGMYGVVSFAAIINPPQSCILAVGAGKRRAVVREDDTIVAATVMNCTLSVDHRSVDGAIGARYLSAFKDLIEQPLRLLA